jgi:hypothetical protein
VADLQRLFPYQGQKVIVGRGSAEKIALADWMVQQLFPADGTVPSGDSPVYPAPFLVGPGEQRSNLAVRIFRMDPKSTNAELTSMVTAIRTVADVQRLFPFESGKAVIANSPPEKMAVAEWLIHELGKPSDPQATHETSLAGVSDGVVRVFYTSQPSTPADLTALVSSRSAVVLRGRPDQMSTAEALVTKFDTKVQ